MELRGLYFLSFAQNLCICTKKKSETSLWIRQNTNRHFRNGFRIYACKRAKNSTAFPRIKQKIQSCNDQLQYKIREKWNGELSSIMGDTI